MKFPSFWRSLTARTSKSKNASNQRRLGGRWRHRAVPRLEGLEDRTAPAIITVNSTANVVAVDAAVTLREAILATNANNDLLDPNITAARVGAYNTGATADTIIFSIPGGPGQEVIDVGAGAGSLPTITEALVIDGTTQPGYTFGVPDIVLDGNFAAISGNGLTFQSAVANAGFTVFGLQIQEMVNNGVRAVGVGSNAINLQDVMCFLDNGDGISLVNVGAVTFTSPFSGIVSVLSQQNFGAGMTVLGATALNITDALFQNNFTGGLRVSDIAGDVTLTRVLALGNDADVDFLGTGFEATDGPDMGNTLAINGNLIISGGSYSSDLINLVPQVRGIFVQSVGGATTFQSSTGPFASILVDSNLLEGVVITDGGTTGSFTAGSYSNNGLLGIPGLGSGIQIASFSGAVTFTNVTATGNLVHGLDADGMTTFTVTGGTFSGNGFNGLDIDTTTTANFNNVSATFNNGDNLSVENSTTVNVTGGTYSDSTGGNGIFLDLIAGAVMVSNASVNNNAGAGLDANRVTGATSISTSDFNNNILEGLAFDTTGAVTTNTVTAMNNLTGIFLDTVASFTDTDGIYSFNFIDGISILDISGSVMLTRTTANDNDADGFGEGDGLHAADGNDAGLNAIGGTLTVNGGSFSEVLGNQAFGIWIERMGGAVIFQNDGLQQVLVSDNDEDGVRILGGTSATFTNGLYTSNDGFGFAFFASDGDGIHLENFTGAVTFTGVRATSNADDGIDLFNVDGTTMLSGVTASNNLNNGLEGTDLANVTISTSTFNDNDADNAGGGDGISLVNVGAVVLTTVTANGNDPGVFVDTAASFSDTGGIFRRNDNGGIVLIDIAGDVTLSGTTLENNDQDNLGDGDGLNATFNVQTVAIGGNLSISNAIIRDTGGISDHQETGVFVDGVGGNVTLTNNTVTGNESHGVFINDTAGNVQVTNGTYSDNGGTGLRLIGVAGTLTAANVTANDNGLDGFLALDVVGASTVNGGFFNDNGIEGIEFEACTDVTFNDVTATGNDDSGALIEECVGTFTANGGVFSVNDNNGIHIQDHVGDVVIDGITAVGNDFDDNGSGDGVFIEADVNPVALDGNLIIDNSLIGFTSPLPVPIPSPVPVGPTQEFGVHVQSLTGSVSMSDNTVTFNQREGVQIDDGGTTAKITGGTYSNNGEDGIDLTSFSGTITVSNATVDFNGSDGLEVNNSQDVVVTSASFSNNDNDGMDLLNVNDVTLTDVTANDNGSNGLEADNVGDVTIDPSFFNGNDEDGIHVNTANDIVIQDTQANSNDADGIDLVNVLDVTLTNVTASFNGEDGIVILDVSAVTATDVTANNNSEDGLDVSDTNGQDITVVRGFYNDNVAHGLNIGSFGSVDDLTLTSVTATGNDLDGVHGVNLADTTISGGTFSNNDDDGLELDGDNVVGSRLVLSGGGQANNNGADGLRARQYPNDPAEVADVSITGWTFNDNGRIAMDGDGIELRTVGDVVFDTVIAMGNDPGAFVSGAASFSDTDGVFSNNANGGIVLEDIAADVTLVRTTADNNDADDLGGGDGVRLQDGGDGNDFAVGGNVLVQGARFRDTGGALTHQENGFFADVMTGKAIIGNVTFEDSAGPLQSMIVTGNEADGVFIDGASIGSFTNGTYSNNADDGLDLNDFAILGLTDVTASGNSGTLGDGAVIANTSIVDVTRGSYTNNGDEGIDLLNFAIATLTGVTATGNGTVPPGEGLDADGGAILSVDGGTYSSNSGDGIQVTNTTIVTLDAVTANGNGSQGFDVDGVVILNVNDFTGLTNTSGFGGEVTNVTTFNFDTTTLPPLNTTADIVEFFPTSGGFNRFQHTRGGSIQQAIRYCMVGTLDVDFFGGDDQAIINPGDYSACLTNLDLDGGDEIIGDSITYLGTPAADDIDISGLVVTVNGVVQPGGLGSFTAVDFELLGADGLAGNDTIDLNLATPGIGYLLVGNTGDDLIRATGTTPTSLIMRGGDNNDTILGSLSGDLIEGGNGNDSLVGNAGNDTINGEAGNDTLVGGAGDDSLSGGLNNDTYVFSGTLLGTDIVNETGGNTDTDTLDFSGFTAVGGVTVNLATTGNQTVNPGDLVINLTSNNSVENVIGTTNNDSITGNTCNNNLMGGNGNDTLVGAAGNDTLDGGLGDDYYPYSGTLLGTDNIVETGFCVDHDHLDFSAFTASGVNVNIGITSLQVVSAGNLNLILSNPEGIENLTGTTLADTLIGNGCDNLITGLAGNDSIQGLAGLDSLLGGDGNDTLVGGLDDDSVFGGNQNDLIIWNFNDNDDTVAGGSGIDEFEFNGNTSLVVGDSVTVSQLGAQNRFLEAAAAYDIRLDQDVETYDVNLLGGPDTATFVMPLPMVTTLDVDGGSENDLVILDLGASIDLPAVTTYNGGTGTNDILRVIGLGTAITNATYNATSVTSGNFNFDGETGSFSNTERIDHVKRSEVVAYNLTFFDDEVNVVNGPVVNGFATTQVNSASLTFPTLNAGNLVAPGVLQVFGSFGSDRFTLNNPTTGAGIQEIQLFGHNPGGVGDDGQADQFFVTPNLNTPYFIEGNDPPPVFCPGDSLDIITTGLVPPTVTTLNPTGPGAGFYSFTNGYENVAFNSIEDLSNRQIVVTGTDYGTIQRIRVFDGTSGAPLSGVWGTGFNPFAFIPAFKSGIRVAAGDINGDCYPDIIVAAGPQSRSFIKVYDGLAARTGVADPETAVIGFFEAFEPTFLGGTFISVADMDNDMFGDIIVGAGKPSTARIRVFSGADVSTGNPLPIPVFPDIVAFPTAIKGGARVAGGDYNGDGQMDIAVTYGSGQTTRVRVLDGTQLFDGFDPFTDLLDDFQPFGSGYKRGGFISMVDLDGDGDQEIQVSTTNEAILQNIDFSTGAGIKVPPLVRSFDYDFINYEGTVKPYTFQVTAPTLYPSSVNGGIRLGSLFDGKLPDGTVNAFFLTAPAKTNPLGNAIFVDPTARTIRRFRALPPAFTTAVEDQFFSNIHEFSQQGYFVAGSKRNDGRISF